MVTRRIVRAVVATFLGVLFSTPVAAVTLSPGDILVVDSWAGLPNGTRGPALLRVNPITGVQTIVSSGDRLSLPMGVVVTQDGRIFVSDGFAKALIEVDPADGSQRLVSSGGSLAYPAGLATLGGGEVVIADLQAFGYRGGLIAVDPETGVQRAVSSGQLFWDPSSIAVLADGGMLVTDFNAGGGTSSANGAVILVSAEGEQAEVASRGYLGEPTGIVVGTDGTIYVTDVMSSGGQLDSSGGVIAIDPTTKVQSMIALGGDLRWPMGLALEASGSLVVVDSMGGCEIQPGGGCSLLAGTLKGLIRVDPATGGQIVVSTGQMFGAPRGLAVVPGRPNSPPVAIARSTQPTECAAAGTPVVLDGSASYDADGDTLGYTWHGAGGQVVGTEAVVTVTQQVRTVGYMLVVDDGRDTATARLSVTVRDTLPPSLSVSLSPTTLWPPNHQMVPIQAAVSASDNCSRVEVQLVSITSSEPDQGLGDGDTPIDVQQLGADGSFALRAERSGRGSGRVYTATYKATELSKARLSTTVAVTVVVPHSGR
jgi:sugar lactone lactonase YvrE